jgi:hypothetical protein
MEAPGARWWLEDAERLNERNPESFFIPPRSRRERLVAGDTVKLVFRFEPPAPNASAERMWVDVVEVGDDGCVGELVNRPAYIQGLEPGSRIEFAPEHVASVAVSEEEAGYDVDAWAAVSRRIRDEAAWPHFVYRNRPELRDEASRDSGWQLWARVDDDEFASNPANVLSWELGWIADRFPVLEELFRAGHEAGERWWDEDARGYRRRV